MRNLCIVMCFLGLLSSVASGGPLEDARGLIDAGDLDEAEHVLERAASDPNLAARATQLRAEIANRQGDYAEGIAWGKKAVAADAGSSNAHYQYAVALRNKMQAVSRLRAMMSLGEYKKELARAIELDGNNLAARQEQIGFFLNAPGIAGGSDDKARELAVELRAIDWRAGTIELAQVENRTDNAAAATALYEEVVERYPDDVGARFNYGFNLQTRERWTEADAQFVRAAKLDDAVVGAALYQRARTRILGRYDQEQAVDFLKRYLAQLVEGAQPSPSAAWWRMGMAYEQLGRIGDARGAFGQALRLDKNNSQAKKAFKALPKE